MLAKLLHHDPGAGRVFTGRRPDLNHNRIPGESFPPTGFGLIRQLLEALLYGSHESTPDCVICLGRSVTLTAPFQQIFSNLNRPFASQSV